MIKVERLKTYTRPELLDIAMIYDGYVRKYRNSYDAETEYRISLSAVFDIHILLTKKDCVNRVYKNAPQLEDSGILKLNSLTDEQICELIAEYDWYITNLDAHSVSDHVPVCLDEFLDDDYKEYKKQSNMSKEEYFTEDYMLRHGILSATNEIIHCKRGRGINELFRSFERVHDILAEYENRAENTISDQIKHQCIARYSQYKKQITENWRFLTADVINKIVKNEQNAFDGIEKYGLYYCIEKIYLSIDFVMRSITEHIGHIRNSLSRYYRIKRYHERLVMLENDQGVTFIMDRDTNKGFMGYFMGSDIIKDKVMPASQDDEYWTFEKREIDKKTYYELM